MYAACLSLMQSLDSQAKFDVLTFVYINWVVLMYIDSIRCSAVASVLWAFMT